MQKVRGVILVVLLAAGPAPAQDIQGVEDCTKTSGIDRRTSCLQSNVNFLQRTINRNALDAQQRLAAAVGENAALRTEIAGLKAVMAELRTRLEALESTKAATEKRDGK